ncbi:MAG: hypothetical protein WA705_04140 [Candidatus Ozemobacteraceae bacterium]
MRSRKSKHRGGLRLLLIAGRGFSAAATPDLAALCVQAGFETRVAFVSTESAGWVPTEVIRSITGAMPFIPDSDAKPKWVQNLEAFPRTEEPEPSRSFAATVCLGLPLKCIPGLAARFSFLANAGKKQPFISIPLTQSLYDEPATEPGPDRNPGLGPRPVLDPDTVLPILPAFETTLTPALDLALRHGGPLFLWASAEDLPPQSVLPQESHADNLPLSPGLSIAVAQESHTMAEGPAKPQTLCHPFAPFAEVRVLPSAYGQIREEIERGFSRLVTSLYRTPSLSHFSVAIACGIPLKKDETSVPASQTPFVPQAASSAQTVSDLPIKFAWTTEFSDSLSAIGFRYREIIDSHPLDLFVETDEGPFFRAPNEYPEAHLLVQFTHSSTPPAVTQNFVQHGIITVTRQYDGSLLLNDANGPRVFPHLMERPAFDRLADYFADRLLALK